jgi:curli production assembly/transport component CsgE
VEKSAEIQSIPPRGADVSNADRLSDALGGLMTTDTITLTGQEFYRNFVQAWSANPLSEYYIVSIHKRPAARYGTLVLVEYTQRRVFEAFLPIARGNVKSLAENAAIVSRQNVTQADLSKFLFHEAHMAADELLKNK